MTGYIRGFIRKKKESVWTALFLAPGTPDPEYPDISDEDVHIADAANPEEVVPEDLNPEKVDPEDVNPEEVDPEDVNPEEVVHEDLNPEEVIHEEVDIEDVNPGDVSRDVNPVDVPGNVNLEEVNHEDVNVANMYIFKTKAVKRLFCEVGQSGLDEEFDFQDEAGPSGLVGDLEIEDEFEFDRDPGFEEHSLKHIGAVGDDGEKDSDWEDGDNPEFTAKRMKRKKLRHSTRNIETGVKMMDIAENKEAFEEFLLLRS